MKYTSINELSKFDYHDAIINIIYIQDGHMIWDISNINASTENSQNDFDKHMCVENAILIFEDAKIECITSSAYMQADEKEATVVPPDAYDAYIQSLSCEYINNLESVAQHEDGKYTAIFNMGGHVGGLVSLSFSKAVIKWDKYIGKAWYES
ncbi:MAG: hypothetical protein FWC89_10290 [Defluviitaleaceae bacterium]|nr:hypothetical protein [Defluviitaleaceae bacterium]